MFDRMRRANPFLQLSGILVVVAALSPAAQAAIGGKPSAQEPSLKDEQGVLHRWVEAQTSGDKETWAALRKARMYGSIEQDAQGQVVAIITCGRWMNDDVAKELADFTELKRVRICQSSLVGRLKAALPDCEMEFVSCQAFRHDEHAKHEEDRSE